MQRTAGAPAWKAAFAPYLHTARAAFMPYWPLGFPSPAASLDYVMTLAEAGADMLELGIPFSDPLADGPTIQAATQQALATGTTVPRCLEMVATLRARGLTIPCALMTYLNPILAYGLERFVQDAAAAGADGCIVPDMPPEEGETLEALCRAHNLALIYLVAPTSTTERIHLAGRHSTGFLYLVSVTGITGAREALPDDLVDFVRRVRQAVSLPLAVGFGISRPAQARAVATLADGVIVGSALIREVQQAQTPEEEGRHHVYALAARLAQAAHGADEVSLLDPTPTP